MTYYILIILCVIVLIAYIFEVTGKFSKIPGVILLMALGLFMRHSATYLGLEIPELSIILPVMGTLGLILIVLEGSLDLKISEKKKNIITESFVSSIILPVSFVFFFSLIQTYFFNFPLKMALLNAIPLGIISSSIAIPSSSSLSENDRDFIIYESSISDIIGILLFDFLIFNHLSFGTGLMFFLFEVFVSIIFSILISAGLALILHKIGHHVKYVIILTSVVLIFTIAKLIHWPSLIVVLIFGLIMNNNHFFQSNYTKKYINFQNFNVNLKAFKQITGELTFLVRSFFFLIFGFYTPIADLLNLQNLLISITICTTLFLLRAIFFKFALKKPLIPLFYFAPRGLITILLFLSLPISLKLPFMSEGVIIQIIFITILGMTFGNMINTKKKEKITSEIQDELSWTI